MITCAQVGRRKGQTSQHRRVTAQRTRCTHFTQHSQVSSSQPVSVQTITHTHTIRCQVLLFHNSLPGVHKRTRVKFSTTEVNVCWFLYPVALQLLSLSLNMHIFFTHTLVQKRLVALVGKNTYHCLLTKCFWLTTHCKCECVSLDHLN